MFKESFGYLNKLLCLNMKTSQLDNTASAILKYLLQLIGIAFFFGILLYSVFKLWLPFLVLTFSRIYYSSASMSAFNTQMILLLVIYSLFCYFANNFILNLYSRGKTKQLIISYLIDLLIVPLSILILIIFYDKTLKVPSADTSILYNIYLITGLLVAKVFIASKVLSDTPAKKKA